ATVRIECRNKDTAQLTYTKEAVTDSTGHYSVLVETDRGDDFCDAVLVKSADPECSMPNEGRDRARVILTRNNGMISNKRFANAMGFLKNTPLANCPMILQKYQEPEE
ncbi:UNVERIFIED_CONTAM: Major pollen allergen Ole e 1, partial [Sesamum latifolium]